LRIRLATRERLEVNLADNRSASHPINAIMNYGYAVLQSQVQIWLVSEGYDPMLGIMHADREDAPPFMFDMMEPERPKVDGAVLGFLKSEALHRRISRPERTEWLG
jgi:CRISPR/Cas system-associated endonuclease Cas1